MYLSCFENLFSQATYSLFLASSIFILILYIRIERFELNPSSKIESELFKITSNFLKSNRYQQTFSITGVGCQIAGFLTVFSSHLSIYTLTVITLERWFAITYAIQLTKRISRKCACYILMGGWIYSIVIAALPVFRISSYSSTR